MSPRVAVVGGSSAGIGKAIAEGLLSRGVDVILFARGAERLQTTANELQLKYPQQTILSHVADSSSAESISEFIQYVHGNDFHPDILILNSGGPKAGAYDSLCLSDWDSAYQSQLRSPLALLEAFLPFMRKNHWGRIVSVSSTIVLRPSSEMILSASLRAALLNALHAIVPVLSDSNVTINSVCPGAVLTDRLIGLIQQQATAQGKSLEEKLVENAQRIPMKRIAEPDEFARLALFLTSDDASYITGTVIPVDGGLLTNP